MFDPYTPPSYDASGRGGLKNASYILGYFRLGTLRGCDVRRTLSSSVRFVFAPFGSDRSEFVAVPFVTKYWYCSKLPTLSMIQMGAWRPQGPRGAVAIWSRYLCVFFRDGVDALLVPPVPVIGRSWCPS